MRVTFRICFRTDPLSSSQPGQSGVNLVNRDFCSDKLEKCRAAAASHGPPYGEDPLLWGG